MLMHAEYTEVSQEVVDAVLDCKARGKRVVAVGSTNSMHSLENIADANKPALIAHSSAIPAVSLSFQAIAIRWLTC